MSWSHRIAAALAVAVMAIAPGAALAQSGGAGDDQYVDPFGSGNSQQHSGSGSKGSPGSATGPALSSTPSLSASSPATTTAAATSGQTLPRTGIDAGLVAAFGLALMLTGVALRLRVRDERL